MSSEATTERWKRIPRREKEPQEEKASKHGRGGQERSK
jgi:hypothetical protein